MSELSIHKCKPKQIREFTLDLLYADLVPFIISSPGTGKSSIVHSIAKELNLFVIDHRLSTSVPEDMSGLPRFDENGFAYFSPFVGLFPIEQTPIPDGYDGWLLFLDEFNSGHKDVIAAAYKLILDRKIGQYDLNKNVAIVCAGNLQSDRAIVNPIGTAMQSRVVTLEMVVDYEQWLTDVAFAQEYDKRIIGFISQFPSKLMDFKPDHTDKTFCCPRTWEFMNRLIQDKQVTNEKIPMYAGTITSSVAVEFVAFCSIFHNLPAISEILADPENCQLPTNNDTRWAIVVSMMEKVNDKTFDKLSIYADRLGLSFRILFYRSIMAKYPELRRSPTFSRAMIELVAYLNG